MAGRIAYYGNIVKDGLILDLDAAKRGSYPGSGVSWNDISGGGNNGTLTNGPTFNSENGGGIVFDGVDDYIRYVLPSNISLTQGTILMFITHSYDGYYLQYYDRPNSRGAATITTVPTGTVQVGVTYNGSNHFFHINGVTIQAERFGSNGYDATTPPSVGLFGRGRTDDGARDNTYMLSFSLNSPSIASNNPPIASTFFENFTTSSLGYFDLSSGVLGKLPSINRPRNLSGKIHNTLMYSRPLSPAEVLQNYNAMKGRYGI